MSNIILSAYACRPDSGSEGGVGWGWLNELSINNQLWVLFYSGQGQKEAVTLAVSQLPQKDNIHLIPILVHKFFQNRFYRIRYEVWQKQAYAFARKIVKENHIDIIHHVTLATWWNCGYLWKINLPFVFGPISGFQKIPFRSLGFLKMEGILYELVRNSLVFLGRNLHWRYKKTIEEANTIICANGATYDYFKNKYGGKRILFLPEIGINKSENLNDRKNKKDNKTYTLIWSGSIIHRKNFGMLYEATKYIPDELDWQLIVLGDGFLLDYWKNKVENSLLKDKIIFKGKVSLSQVKAYYKNADVFVFPSLREASGTVILEAMSAGLPVIALKLNGAVTLLDDKSGILIDVKNKKQMIEDFSNAIIKLYENTELRESMGNKARERALNLFTWEARGNYMNELYKELISDT